MKIIVQRLMIFTFLCTMKMKKLYKKQRKTENMTLSRLKEFLDFGVLMQVLDLKKFKNLIPDQLF